jgi:hypothetical protein
MTIYNKSSQPCLIKEYIGMNELGMMRRIVESQANIGDILESVDMSKII